MTQYYTDNYNVYNKGSFKTRLKKLTKTVRRHVTIDAGGLIVGFIGLGLMFI